MKKLTKTALAKELGISRSSLYYHPKKPVADGELKNQIIAVMAEHPAYGHRRIAIALGRNKKAIIRIMNNNCLKPQIRRGRRPAKPEDLSRPATRVDNILKVLCPIRPNIVWAGDFTYLWFKDRFWYVATVIDIYTREIVGWHIANHHTTGLIMDAFNDAVRRTRISPKYFHSDQGSEYVAGAYESLLADHQTALSHSRKSSPCGTDVEVAREASGRVVAQIGVSARDPGATSAFPPIRLSNLVGGEVFIRPTHVHGRIVVDWVSSIGSSVPRGATIELSDGQVVGVSGGGAAGKRLREIMKQHGLSRVTSVCVGANPYLRLCGVFTNDCKVCGTLNFGFGSDAFIGGDDPHTLVVGVMVKRWRMVLDTGVGLHGEGDKAEMKVGPA